MARDFGAIRRRRRQAVRLFEKGESQAQVARLLGVSRQTAMVWWNTLEHEGSEALAEPGAAGRPSRIADTDLRAIEKALLAGPRAHGYETELWTLPRIATRDRTRHGRGVPPRARLATHAQARLVAPEADHKGSRARREGHSGMGSADLAGGKKNAARRHATIVFLDESGFSERPAVRRTWARRGQTPVLIHRHRAWNRLSAIGALAYRPAARETTPSARLYLALHRDVIRSAEVIRFLRHLRRHIRGPIVLLWDGLHAHRGRETTAYLESCGRALCALRIPAYAPELNPVEGLWAWLKGAQVPNLCADGLSIVRDHVTRGRRRAARRPHLLFGFLRKTGLSL